MDKHLEEEALMKKLMEELPMSNEMPPNVRNKAMNIAVETNRRAQAARRPRAVAWMTAGIATFAIGAFFLMPKPASAKAWTMVKQAVEKITSVQMDIKVKDAKEGPQIVRIAMQGDRVLIDAGEGTKLFIGGDSFQVYEAKTNTITKMTMPAGMMDFMPDVMGEVAGAFDLKKEIAEMETKYGKDHIRVMPIRTENGRNVYDVVMTDPEGPGKAFLTVDADTDLPIYIDASGMEDGNDENVEITLRYNGNAVIEPNFPKDAKIQSFDMGNLMNGEMKGKDLGKAFENFNPFGKHGK
ncbi:MAG: hypothetical protein H7Y17_14515 [Chlorobia bacterium]|nr:hypothetical protein [Fimbriimonadaceae bacterium]